MVEIRIQNPAGCSWHSAFIHAILTRISLAVSGGLESDSLLVGLMIMLSVMVIFTAVIFTMIFVGFRFYKSVFTDQGYLTNTLP